MLDVWRSLSSNQRSHCLDDRRLDRWVSESNIEVLKKSVKRKKEDTPEPEKVCEHLSVHR